MIVYVSVLLELHRCAHSSRAGPASLAARWSIAFSPTATRSSPTTTSRRARSDFLADGFAPVTTSRLVAVIRSIGAALAQRHAWRGHRVSPRRQRRRPLRHRAPPQGPRAEHHRDVQRPRSDAGQRRSPDRVCLDRIDLRRSHSDPDTGERAVPGADVSLRRLEARGRGTDPGVLRGLWLSGVDLPVRVDPRRALHPRTRLRLLQELRDDPTRLARAR